ncbi:Zinc finger homeobox protein 2 [Larimichthys crocea]|uniref:Uncharacterized protein n=1 Tax=Larimichthys crocea TaxID=215358 RepID=A0ACD3QRQ2_LARCR|nr:Zinc finger homeobox protein 2 [Larimichthys crocea]
MPLYWKGSGKRRGKRRRNRSSSKGSPKEKGIGICGVQGPSFKLNNLTFFMAAISKTRILGNTEFEQISEWVHLPKKVVQIWFQNMRARERKGEVRFISDGTLAAVGKPLHQIYLASF